MEQMHAYDYIRERILEDGRLKLTGTEVESELIEAYEYLTGEKWGRNGTKRD